MRNRNRRGFIAVLALCAASWFSSGPAAAQAPSVGDKAPDFDLPATIGKQAKLADFIGNKVLVLFFYNAAFTNT